MAVLLAVWGASPGIGKSTLSSSLAGWVAEAHMSVYLFREEEVLTRPQFAAVAKEFNAARRVTPATLLESTVKFVDSVLLHGDEVVVADALMPFVPTLLAMGHSERQIEAFMADLAQALVPLRPIMVFLDGDPAIALARAAAREQPGWLDRYVDKLALSSVFPPVRDLASAIDYLRRERAATLRVAEGETWRLARIERASELTETEVLHTAQRLLWRLLPYAELTSPAEG